MPSIQLVALASAAMPGAGATLSASVCLDWPGNLKSGQSGLK